MHGYGERGLAVALVALAGVAFNVFFTPSYVNDVPGVPARHASAHRLFVVANHP